MAWSIGVACLAAAMVAGCALDVPGPNRPPVAVAGFDQRVAVGERAALDGSASFDPDGDALRFEWTLLDRPADSEQDLVPGEAGLASLLVDEPGIWLVQLVVRDTSGTASEPDVLRLLTYQACSEDIDCDDHDACNGLERCLAGACQPGEPLDCDDDNPCTDDCDPAYGCVIIYNDDPCDDGDPCTKDDVCADGLCAGTPYSCNDGNPCTDDICNGDGTCRNEPLDQDGDGHPSGACGGDDCDDDPQACGAGCYPGNADPDICDGHDQDCDGQTDEDPDLLWYFDSDGDGYGDPATAVSFCVRPSGMVADGTDCDDGERSVHPDAREICNNADDDCDGIVDDGLADCKCADGADVPDPAETCSNGIDDDCNGAVDDGCFSCTPGEKFCDQDGRTLHLCNPDGTGYDQEDDERCGFVCHADHCIFASNVTDGTMAGCDMDAPRLTPTPGAQITYDQHGIHCDPDCGDGSTQRIEPLQVATQLSDPSVFCLSELDLPEGVSLGYQGSRGPMILLVASDAAVGGQIDFDGQAPTQYVNAGGTAGPGGGDGGDPCTTNDCTGNSGVGACPGTGGHHNYGHGAGGGGGGYGGQGGDGGDVAGGSGGDGGGPCGDPALKPLAGGSGGGAGADGNGGQGSGPGGGGGGAIQISARGSLTVSGRISASGGPGYPQVSNHGAGGGGAGGAILLEAPQIALIDGPELLVEGGDGGAMGIYVAPGASGSEMDGEGGSYNSTGGGGGGGGGGGRVRINSLSDTECNGVSPNPACMPSSL
ncbi:MAG: hypothetical protein JXR96_04430 [Deltaproteobacteria bacterium]|nr:hypothetical protein [Deltaproteobacteria bacterium]